MPLSGLFVAASTRQLTWFFPQRMNNAVMLWAVLNGTVGFLMFWLSYRFFGKKKGVTPEMWGAGTSLSELWRTFLLAMALFMFFFMTLFVVYYFLHVDYRFLFMGVRTFQPPLLALLAMYVPFFFIFLLPMDIPNKDIVLVIGAAAGFAGLQTYWIARGWQRDEGSTVLLGLIGLAAAAIFVWAYNNFLGEILQGVVRGWMR